MDAETAKRFVGAGNVSVVGSDADPENDGAICLTVIDKTSLAVTVTLRDGGDASLRLSQEQAQRLSGLLQDACSLMTGTENNGAGAGSAAGLAPTGGTKDEEPAQTHILFLPGAGAFMHGERMSASRSFASVSDILGSLCVNSKITPINWQSGEEHSPMLTFIDNPPDVWHDTKLSISVRRVATYIKGYMERTHAEKIHLVGYSRGGLVAALVSSLCCSGEFGDVTLENVHDNIGKLVLLAPAFRQTARCSYDDDWPEEQKMYYEDALDIEARVAGGACPLVRHDTLLIHGTRDTDPDGGHYSHLEKWSKLPQLSATVLPVFPDLDHSMWFAMSQSGAQPTEAMRAFIKSKDPNSMDRCQQLWRDWCELLPSLLYRDVKRMQINLDF